MTIYSLNKRSFTRSSVLILCSIIASFFMSNANAQSCHQRATTTSALTVYDRPPDLKTGRGVVYGGVTARLTANSQVFVCREVAVGFGFSKLRWYQIAFRSTDNSHQWRFGWVAADQLHISKKVDSDREFAFIAAARAETSPYNPPIIRAELAPDADPPQVPTTGDVAGPDQSMAFSLELNLWIFLLLALVAGILAQTLVDLLDARSAVTVKGASKRLIKPLLFSPIVFLAFMETAELNVGTDKQLLILSLLAFQAGFFWQNVFAQSTPSPKGAET